MLRIKRISKKLATPQSLELIENLERWRKELALALGQNSAELLPHARIDNDYINFTTEREGGTHDSSLKQLNANEQKEFQNHIAPVIDFLDSKKPLADSSLETQRSYLSALIRSAIHLVVFEQGVCVLLPFETQDEEKARLAAAPLPPPVTKKGCILPLLLGLLGLLLLLLTLWYFLLRPWPFAGSLNDAPELQPVQDTPEQVAEPEEPAPVKEPESGGKETEQEDENVVDEDALKAQELAEQKRLEEERRAQEAAALKLKQEQEAKEKAERAAREKAAQEKAAQEKAARNAKAVPKCKTLKQDGTMPKMVIAFDGSQSMLINDVPGSASRLVAATSAARKLADSIDKNVEIGFVEINGCPAAKSRGFYTGIQRPALKDTISGINPMRYDGMTPLVDGLQQISRMTDGVNADAVGILISDGEDTCAATRNLDVCSVAKAIHKRKPRLKIHTILIGEDAGQAACIARITGGKVFSPKNASQINADLQSSGSEMKKVCEE